MPASSAVKVLVAPVPEVEIFPGVLINVHVPDEGKPLNATLPVDKVHVVCVMVPTTGADGVTGCAFITTFEDESDMQPDELVTVNV